MSLEALGLAPDQRDAFEADLEEGCTIGRVIAVDRNGLQVDMGSGPVHGELTGRLRFVADSGLELPATGDWVARQVDDELIIVADVLPRRTTLKRRRPGKQTDYQMIAANIDVAFILSPADQPVNRRSLDRYVVAALDGGIQPLIVISKSDLVDSATLAKSAIEAGELCETLAVSSMSDEGAGILRNRMNRGSTYALLGPSGVGKSTLLNRLLGGDVFATQAVRKGGKKGKHTTTRRELAVLESGALVIDTPGMREFGMTDMQEGVDAQFAEIAALAEGCRYADCTHTNEPGCRVLEAVEAGELSEDRLYSFMKLGREAAHYERSYLESRRRDKEFGKHVKRVLKAKKDRRSRAA